MEHFKTIMPNQNEIILKNMSIKHIKQDQLLSKNNKMIWKLRSIQERVKQNTNIRKINFIVKIYL